MRFRSLKRWNIKPELDGLLFFAQRMDELLWDFTLDTHKPMALNAPYLCKEAISLLEDIEAELIEPANLKPVLDELVWSVQHDPVAKSLLDLPIEHYVLTSEGVKLAEQKLRLDVLGQTLQPFRYLHRAFDQIAAQVKAVEKKKLDSSIRTMVTTLINMGVSKQSLHKRSNDFFFGAEGEQIDKPEQIDSFLKSIYPYSHEFTVYFVVSKLIETVKDSLTAFRISLLDELPDELKSIAAKNKFAKGEDESYAEVGPFTGLDVVSAQEKAANRLDNLSDLFTLFYHQRKINWRPQAIVKQCCSDGPVFVTLTKGAMEKPFDLPPEKASKELNRLLRNSATRGTSFDRFNRVADLHGICVSTDIIENQLVTLWTSLETLIPSHTGVSKITNVLEAMIPFLMVSYIKRLVQRFNHDLITWRRWRVKRILNKVPDIDSPNTLHRTLAMLAVSTNDEIRSELYAELKDFHLLRFRAFQLSEILSSTEKLTNALASHEKKLRWQIRRIYRTRNLIVHSGKRPSYIHSLIENGHDYLDQIIFDVMKLSCGEYRTSTLEQAFELSKIRHKKFMDQLASVKTFDAQNCAFLCEEFDTLTDYVNESWGETQEGAPNSPALRLVTSQPHGSAPQAASPAAIDKTPN
jgi:hypothetical protein